MPKRTKSSRRWLQEHERDVYVKRAREEGYRSRAVFKLEEIQRTDRILRPGMTLVDLGAAPRGGSQLSAKILGGKAVSSRSTASRCTRSSASNSCWAISRARSYCGSSSRRRGISQCIACCPTSPPTCRVSLMSIMIDRRISLNGRWILLEPTRRRAAISSSNYSKPGASGHSCRSCERGSKR